MSEHEYGPLQHEGQQNLAPTDQAPEQAPEQALDESPKKGWRSFLRVHEATALFPLVSRDELQKSWDDIKTIGMKHPIVFWYPGEEREDYKLSDCFLLDGRNRLDALEMAGIEFQSLDKFLVTEPYDQKAANGCDILNVEYISELGSPYRPGISDPYAYVISVNLIKRHLKPEDRADLIRKVNAIRPELSIRGLAEITGTPKSTVADALKEDGSGVRTRTPGEKSKVKGRDGKSYPAKAPKKEKPAEAAAPASDGTTTVNGQESVELPFGDPPTAIETAETSPDLGASQTQVDDIDRTAEPAAPIQEPEPKAASEPPISAATTGTPRPAQPAPLTTVDILEALERLSFDTAKDIVAIWFCGRAPRQRRTIIRDFCAINDTPIGGQTKAVEPNKVEPVEAPVVSAETSLPTAPDAIASEPPDQQKQPTLTENEARVYRIFLNEKAISDAGKGTSYIGILDPRWDDEFEDAVKGLIAKGLLEQAPNGAQSWRAK